MLHKWKDNVWQTLLTFAAEYFIQQSKVLHGTCRTIFVSVCYFLFVFHFGLPNLMFGIIFLFSFFFSGGYESHLLALSTALTVVWNLGNDSTKWKMKCVLIRIISEYFCYTYANDMLFDGGWSTQSVAFKLFQPLYKQQAWEMKKQTLTSHRNSKQTHSSSSSSNNNNEKKITTNYMLSWIVSSQPNKSRTYAYTHARILSSQSECRTIYGEIRWMVFILGLISTSSSTCVRFRTFFFFISFFLFLILMTWWRDGVFCLHL